MITYDMPKERFLPEPKDESCYEYLMNSFKRISVETNQPDYIAFVTPVANVESKMMMSEFISEINKLASWLVSKGFKKGDVFTAFMPTCGHAAIAFYACSKIGVIANFVHPLTPLAQLLEIMENTKSKGVYLLDLFARGFAPVTEKYLTLVGSISDLCEKDSIAFKYAKGNEMQNAQFERLPNHYIYSEVMALDLPEAETDHNPGKDDGFYLHGGGTTGKSKTIIHSSYSMNYLAYAMYACDLPHDYTDVYTLCVLPCFHAYGLGVSIHYSICNCYRPIMISKFDPVQACELIRKYKVKEILGVPKMFEKLLATDGFYNNPGIKHLHILSVGGDYVSPEFIRKFNKVVADQGSTALLAPGYGLTEMAAVCTTNNGPVRYFRDDTVGYPILGVELEIWDDECNKLQPGEIGEVVLTGETMMNRYLPDDVIKDSGIYTDKNGKKWIRTGDVGYLTDDGHLKFTSRIKRIIVIAGYNIYPATIENKVLTGVDEVLEACACQGYDENKKPYVKLFVAPKDENADKAELEKKVMEFCKANIEGYGCPRKVFAVDALPRTKMEKIDFVKLSDPVPAE